MSFKGYPKLTLLFLVVTLPVNAQRGPDASATQKLHTLEAVKNASFKESMSERDREQSIVSSYDKLFPASTIKSELTPKELRSNFEAAAIAAFFGLKERHVRRMEEAFHALQARNLATEADYKDMQGTYIASRMLDKAASLRAQHPGMNLEDIPRLTNTEAIRKQPSELVPAADMASLAYRVRNIRSKSIVIIAHPLCHFSANLVHDIQETTLASTFKQAIWLVPPDTRFNLREVQTWNARYPDEPLSLAYKTDDWPMFDAWATPTFYFMNNGKVIAKVQGWPPNGGIQELTRAIATWNASKP